VTEGKRVTSELLRLQEVVEALVSDMTIGDHAFHLHIDGDVIEGCADTLEKMGRAIENERHPDPDSRAYAAQYAHACGYRD
jgi:hypothetical protein